MATTAVQTKATNADTTISTGVVQNPSTPLSPLPKALRTRLIGCRVVMPLYEAVPQELRDKMTFLNLALLPTSENLPPFMGLNVVVSDFGGEKKSNAILVTFEFLSILCFFLPNYLLYYS